jgi:hypothetical protein
MSERDEKRGGSGVAIGCLLVFLLGLPVYVLSIGPAVWMANRSEAVGYAIQVVYFPLGLVAYCLPPFKDFVEWYISFWQ